MNELKKEDEKELQELLGKLRKYAHRGNSKCDIEECPEECDVKHKLGLDTAIAWIAAEKLDGLSNVQTAYGIVDALTSVADLHLDKYEKLYSLLNECDWLLFYCTYG